MTTDVQLILSTFDLTEGQPAYRRVRGPQAIRSWKPLRAGDYAPRGATPLRDAAAKFIADLDAAATAAPDAVTLGLLVDESGSMGGNEESVIAGVNEFVAGLAGEPVGEEARGAVLAVILTDGLENASREVSAVALRATIAARERAGWTFIYLGANQDAWTEGEALGFSGGATGQAVNFVPSAAGSRAAFAAVADDAREFVADRAAYQARRARSSRRSLDERGDERGATSAPPRPRALTPRRSVRDIAPAVERAREATRRGS